MGLFSAIFGRKNRLQNNGKPIRIPAPPVISVAAWMTSAEAAGKIAMASALSSSGETIYPLDNSYRDTLDRAYFAVVDSAIPDLARWLFDLEGSLTTQGYGYRSESGDCDDRADFAQSCRRFFRAKGATMLICKLSVAQINSALGIGSGGRHQLVAILGQTQWWVIDPATGQYCALGKYPNRESIGKTYVH